MRRCFLSALTGGARVDGRDCRHGGFSGQNERSGFSSLEDRLDQGRRGDSLAIAGIGIAILLAFAYNTERFDRCDEWITGFGGSIFSAW